MLTILHAAPGRSLIFMMCQLKDPWWPAQTWTRGSEVGNFDPARRILCELLSFLPAPFCTTVVSKLWLLGVDD
ncbi:hypothetical protein EJB05_16665 [Eragrostis curvula]|uniref:Uncharacterized protein n=1 Tax=Eragrostis curvula TaxID=38414 RepID=A0A5J9VFI2_9POAL|nr:hypothetical protein EJB05_16665 [Eragrostis curvula]